MWAAIIAFLPFISKIIDWFAAKKAEQTAADNAEQTAEQQHANDGLQSVSDKDSSDAQNAALDKIKEELSKPPAPAAGTTPEKKP